MAENMARVVVAFLALMLAAMVGIQVLDGIATSEVAGGTSGDTQQISRAVELDGTNFVDFGSLSGQGTNETIRNTRNRSVNLTGATDSYVESDSSINVASDGNWTVSTWARVDQASASENMSLITLGGQLVVWYNGSSSEYQAWVYDDGTGDAKIVNVSAPNQPGNFTQVMVVRNDTDVTIYQNATPGETKDVSTAGDFNAPLNTTNYDGRIDETRTWDSALNSSDRNATVTEPIDPLPNRGVTSRIYYDFDRSTQPIYFAGATLQTSNVTYSGGLNGSVLEENGLITTNDYRWRNNGPRIAASQGGKLDGAPVAFATFDFSSVDLNVINAYGDMISVAALIGVIAIAGVLIARLREMT